MLLLSAIAVPLVLLALAAIVPPPIEGDWVSADWERGSLSSYWFFDLRDGYGIVYFQASDPGGMGKYERIGRRTYRFDIHPLTRESLGFMEVGWLRATLYRWLPDKVYNDGELIRDLHFLKRRRIKQRTPSVTHEGLYDELKAAYLAQRNKEEETQPGASGDGVPGGHPAPER